MTKKVVVIGGGTGTMAVLAGLKQYNNLDISVIVSMTDDGGSNHVVRDEFGLLPLSDLRKSIIALSESNNTLLRQLFTYRFNKGEGISGHTLGNLMMIALVDICGSEIAAIEAAKTLFHVRGHVIPVTTAHTSLVATYSDGHTVTGEHLIDEPEEKESRSIVSLSLSANVSAHPSAIDAIESADIIIAGPGDLYTSTLANIIVSGIPQAIHKSRAQYIFINNLMTKRGQTDRLTAKQLVSEIGRYSNRMPDIVVQHVGKFDTNALALYAARGEQPIIDDLDDSSGYRVVRVNVAEGAMTTQQQGDTLARSLIRHDAETLGKIIYELIQE